MLKYRVHSLKFMLLVVLLLVSIGAVVNAQQLPLPGERGSVRAPFTSCVDITDVPQTTCEALVALYNSTDGANWIDHTDWLQTDTVCTWFGVTCEFFAVTTLDLAGNNLVGTLPTELVNLDGLTDLDLSFNTLSGTIPDGLGLILSLAKLNLGNNQLTGTIPAALTGLTDLEELALNNNQLTGDLPGSLVAWASLHRLELHHNLLTGEIPTGIGLLTGLQVLTLNGNQLSGEIPLELTALTVLLPDGLALDYNSLTATNPTVATFLDTADPDWYLTQTVAPTDLTATFDAATGVLTFGWTPIPYIQDTGDYTLACGTVSGGPYDAYITQTEAKLDFEVSFVGLPVATYYCTLWTYTAAHPGNQGELTSLPAPEIEAVVSVQLPPENDDSETPALVNNGPYQVYNANFNQASADGSDTPDAPGCTSADLDQQKSIYFEIPPFIEDTTRLNTPKGGPGHFTRGQGVIRAGGPGHFTRGWLPRAAEDADTVIAVYRVEADGSLLLLKCNDDDPDATDGASRLSFERDTDYTYRVVIWSKDDASDVVFTARIREPLVNASFDVDLDGDKDPDGWKIKNPDGAKLTCKDGTYVSAPCAVQIKGIGAKVELKQKTGYLGKIKVGDVLGIALKVERRNLKTGGVIQFVVSYKDGALGTDGKVKVQTKLPEGSSSGFEEVILPTVTAEGDVRKALIKIRYNATGGKLRVDDVAILVDLQNGLTLSGGRPLSLPDGVDPAAAIIPLP